MNEQKKLDEIVAYVEKQKSATSMDIFDNCDLVPDKESSLMLYQLVKAGHLFREKLGGQILYYFEQPEVILKLKYSDYRNIERIIFIDYCKWESLTGSLEYPEAETDDAVMFFDLPWIPKSQLRLFNNQVWVSTWFKNKTEGL